MDIPNLVFNILIFSKKNILVGLLILFLMTNSRSFAQTLYYQDFFNGGITADGFSTTISNGSGIITVDIVPGSSIRKAFLLCGRHGKPLDINIDFNGFILPYSDYTIVSDPFLSAYAGPDLYATVHMVDVTDYVSSAQNSYNITIPLQSPIGGRYTDLFLIVYYENLFLPPVNACLFINNDTIDNNILFQMDSINPIDTSFEVGLSIYGGYMCDTMTEKTTAFVNGQYLGSIGGNDYNNTTICAGVVGSFNYQSNMLFGLADDSSDYFIKANDGLANIKDVDSIKNKIAIYYYSTIGGSPNNSNSVWGNVLIYSTPCDTFSAGISKDTLMDLGDSTHLSAYGGYKYKWQPSFGLSCDTCASTIAKPDSSTLYTCTIYNNDSCSKVLPVKVNIYNNVSVEPVAGEIKIILFPNPAENNITLRQSSNSELEFSITSIQGQELKRGVFYTSETEIDVSELSPGFYFINLNGEGFKKSLRFIKR